MTRGQRRRGREQPPVPPLADAAVARIERGVFAALDRDAAEQRASRRWPVMHRWRWAVVAGAAAMAALATWGMRTWWRVPGSLAHGARIATATSPSHLTVEGAAIDVAPASAVTFAPGDDEGDGATVIRLERGSVTCEVAPRAGRAPFVVEAGTTRVTVVGTRFAVTRVGDRAQVSVVHGTVQVDDDGVTRLVHAGERYLPGADTATVATAMREDAPEPVLTTASLVPDESPQNSARTRMLPNPLPRPRGSARERGNLASGSARARRSSQGLPSPWPSPADGRGDRKGSRARGALWGFDRKDARASVGSHRARTRASAASRRGRGASRALRERRRARSPRSADGVSNLPRAREWFWTVGRECAFCRGAALGGARAAGRGPCAAVVVSRALSRRPQR